MSTFGRVRELNWLVLGQVGVLSLLLLGLSYWFLRGGVFVSSDTHLRFVQIEQLAGQGVERLAIDYPLRQFDPELRHTPYYFAFSVVAGEIFLQISPYFPLLVAGLYGWGGTAVLGIIPALGTLFTAVAVYHLTRLADLPRPLLAMWATALATPLLFYSLELWDHTLGVALAMWGVLGVAYGLQRGQVWALAGGGVALGLGLGQRPELYVFTVAVGLALLLLRVGWRVITAVVLGGFLGAIPVWLSQWVWVGHPLGMAFAPHLLGYGVHSLVPSSGSYPPIVKIWYLSLGSQSEGIFTLTATLLVLIGYIFLSYTLYRTPLAQPQGLWLPLLLISVGYLLWLWQLQEGLIIGILPTLPLWVLGAVYPKRQFQAGFHRRLYAFIGLTTLLFLSLMIFVWPSYGGTQWGSRYLLPGYPLLLWLAWYVYASYDEVAGAGFRRWWGYTAVLLLLLSFILQLGSISHLHSRHQQIAQLQQEIAAIPADIILTDHVFLPIFMSGLRDKNFLYVRDGAEINILLQRLDEAGIHRVGIFPGTEFAPPPPPLAIPATLPDGRLLPQVAPFTYEWSPLPTTPTTP
jgi:hypothetical protein